MILVILRSSQKKFGSLFKPVAQSESAANSKYLLGKNYFFQRTSFRSLLQPSQGIFSFCSKKNEQILNNDLIQDTLQIKEHPIIQEKSAFILDGIHPNVKEEFKQQKQVSDQVSKSLVWQVQQSIQNVKSKYYHSFDSFADLQIKDNVSFFKEVRQEIRVNDVALFGYFSLKEVRDKYKKEHNILSFMLDDKTVQKFREYFDKNKKFQKLYQDYFRLPFSEKEKLVTREFGNENTLFFMNFYPLYNMFLLYATSQLKKKYIESIELCQKLKLEAPHSLYPETRKMKRKIIYHYGPTNSGKTYAALISLMKANSGIYCGPLRLLASEIYQKFKSAGMSCNLLTGQEKIIEPDSNFYSCTAEIACQKAHIEFECAVIDEIQYLGDAERGGAWTKCFLGLQAKEIHLCGDGRALNLVKSICEEIGDEFSTVKYERMSKLKVLDKEYKLFDDLEEGDCFISFSVGETMGLKQKVNSYMNQKNRTKNENYCSIIYGRQPPEIKKIQAELFNNRVNKFMVATNAIGLGLNLNIKRIVFMTFTKNLKTGRQGIDKHEILQIAGRAGRYKEDGVVCARHSKQITLLKETLERRDSLIEKQNVQNAAFFPTFEQIEELSEWLNKSEGVDEEQNLKKKKKQGLSEVFSKFANYSMFKGQYFIENEEEFCIKADITDNLGLSLKDQYSFSLAPMRMGRQFEKERQLFKLFAQKYAQGLQVELPDILSSKKKLESLKNSGDQGRDILALYESLYYILEVYVWLCHKFGEESFPDKEKANESKKLICSIMTEIHQKNDYS